MRILPSEERVAIRRAIGLLNVDKLQFWWSVIAGTLTIVCTVGLGAVSAWLIARASQLPVVSVLSLAATIVRAFGVSKPIFRYLRQIASHRVALYGMSNLRFEVYSRLADSRIDGVTAIKRGDLLTRTGRDTDSVGDLIVRALLPMCVAFFGCVSTLLIVGHFSLPIAAIVACGFLVSGVLGPAIAMIGARRHELSQIDDRAQLAAVSLTMLESAEELRVSGSLDSLERSNEELEGRIFAHRDAAARPMAICNALEHLAMLVAVVGAIIVGAHQLDSGQLAAVEYAIVVLVPLAAFEATNPLGQAAVQLIRSAGAARRILSLLDATEQGHRSDSAEGEPDVLEEQPGTVQSEGGLRVIKASIGWPDGPIIAGSLSLEVPRGSTLAIVGASGIGKTTLLYTLAGLLPPKDGSVTLDGREVSELTRQEVSDRLILTAEDAHVFETSVLENIRVARADVSEEEATALLHRVGLGTWLSELPEGVHTLVRTDATSLSGGERRRLLLARALASPAEYLLLDEPAEHLDAQTADALMRDLLAAGRDGDHPRTIVLVTHRLTPLKDADHVVVLAGAEGTTAIRAAGTHRELEALLPDYRWSLQQEDAEQ